MSEHLLGTHIPKASMMVNLCVNMSRPQWPGYLGYIIPGISVRMMFLDVVNTQTDRVSTANGSP
jgi:hypothetical protein